MFLKAFSKNSKVFLPALGLLVALVSCYRQPVLPEHPVARVGNAWLSLPVLQASMPSGLTSGDSAEMARKRIRSWVNNQVLLQKAESNLGEEAEAEIGRKIDEYRQSLVIYYYEEQLTRKLLDTVVPDKEIEDYYNANPNQFILKSDIVRCRFAKLPVEASSAGEIRTLLFADSMSSQDLFKLAGLCGNESGNYFLDGDTWLFFSDLLKEIPIQAYNRQDFLKEHRKIELESGGYVYFLNILDFKVKDMVSPLSFENQRIRNIILNLRKKELLRKIEADLMEDAKSAGLVEIY